MITDHLPGSFFGPPTLVDLIRHRATYFPSDLAFGYLTDGDQDMIEITNADLDRRARAIAARLLDLGMAGERAMLLFPPGLDFITAFFGCLYAGVIAVPVYPPRKNRAAMRVQIIAEDCSAKVALTNSEVLGRTQNQFSDVDFLSSVVWLNTDEIEEGTEWNWFMPDIHGDTIAFLQYTSGSTGNPKGVVLNHSNLLHNSATIASAFELTRTTIATFWLPTYHDMGLIGGILQPLYVGRPNILLSPMAFLQRPFRWLKAISRFHATISGGPNFAYELCVKKVKPEQVEQLDLSSWKLAFSGAEPIRPDTLQAFTEKFAPAGFDPHAFYPCYGLAEATLLVTGGYVPTLPMQCCFDSTMLSKGWAVETSNSAPNSRCFVGNGRPMPDQAVAIVNPDTNELCVDGEIGEIWIHGPSTAQGYWEKPEVTREMFHAYIKVPKEEKIKVRGPYFRTGDLGFVWKKELYVSGRLKDMIIWHGVNVYPQDVEKTIQEADPLCRADAGAVFAIENGSGELLAAVQEVDKRPGADYAEVIENIKKAVSAAHELPLSYIYLIRHGAVPKTSSGKIQRNAARQEFLDGNFAPLAVWDAQSNEFLDEAGYAAVKEEKCAELAKLSAQNKKAASASEHTSPEVLAMIPDLDTREKAFLLPKSFNLDTLVMEEDALRNSTLCGCLASSKSSNLTLSPMIGAYVSGGAENSARNEAQNEAQDGTADADTLEAICGIKGLEELLDDEDDESIQSAEAALGGDGAGFDPILSAFTNLVETMNSEGLPEELRQPKCLRRLVKIIQVKIQKVARERAAGMTVETPITELGMDSLERMEIISSLEETFGGHFPEAILLDLTTIREVAEAICKYFGESPKLHMLLAAPIQPVQHSSEYARKSTQTLSLGTQGAKSKASANCACEISEENYIFEKSPKYLALRQSIDGLLASGMRNPYFTTHEGMSKDTTLIGGKEYIHFSSYNYLGLGSHPEVIDFVKGALDKYGCSCSASRLVSGQKTIHVEFEKEMSEFLGTEDAIIFSAGHHVNESVLGHLVGKGDLILHDSLVHNSMVMGAMLSGADRRPFEHGNWKMAEDILKQFRSEYRKVWIAIEGVYSMDGDIAPLPEFIELKKRYKAFLYVDEAHSLGTLGKRGAGISEYYGISPAEGDLWMGTASKSFASCGGFISGKKPIIEYLRYTTPGFVFSAAISPAATAAALGALRILKREPERLDRLHRNSQLFLSLAKEAGLDTGLSDGTPVIPIIYGNSQLSIMVAQRLFDRGINVQPIMYPAVEEKAARLRFFLTAIHTEEQIRFTVKALVEETEAAKKLLGIS